MKATAAIVEDEPLARKTLRGFLADVDWLEVIGEAADGITAVELINRAKPDLVFLDIHLPELSGLELLKRLIHEPAIIFTTAHDRHAVAAFELAAIDYLLKPFGRARLQQALARAHAALQKSEPRPGLPDARLALSASPQAPMERILIRDGGRIVPLATREIERIDADGDYAAVRARGRTFLVSLPLADFETKLDPRLFVRVHRSHVVNIDFVAAIEPFDNSQLILRMKDGAKITASRTASKLLRGLAL
ncbi:MAG: LytTR family DNA-binding domain-containing protein [Opitutaceae bacterium]|jgi:two-component system LytT family response regulator